MKRMRGLRTLLSIVSMLLAACSKPPAPDPAVPRTAPPTAGSLPAEPAPAAAPAAAAPAAAGRGVKTEMRNVNFHFTDTAAAKILTLTGEMLPTGKNEMPVVDDKRSFELRVNAAKIEISPEALGEIMNKFIFAKADSPLKDLSVSIEKDKLVIKGKLAGKGLIPFQTSGTLGVTEDGRLSIHTEKLKALHLPVKGMMNLFGMDLANVLNTSKIDGLELDKDDLLMDLSKLLPPPHMIGKATAVGLEDNRIVTTMGTPGKFPLTSAEKGNYMRFQGGAVRFGKLIMQESDVTVLDLDSADALDWNQDHYKDQLVAGYSKLTPSFGLRAYVKDFSKLPHPAGRQGSAPDANPAPAKN